MTSLLPDEARVPGVYEKHRRAYPFCLPVEFASHNLLPDVRDGAVRDVRDAEDRTAEWPRYHPRDVRNVSNSGEAAAILLHQQARASRRPAVSGGVR